MSQPGTSLGSGQAEKFSLPRRLCKEFRKRLVPTLLFLCPPPTIGKWWGKNMYTSGWERCWRKPSPGTKTREPEWQSHGNPMTGAAKGRRGVTWWLQTAQSLGGLGWREAPATPSPRGQRWGWLASRPSSNSCNGREKAILEDFVRNLWPALEVSVTERQHVLDCCSPSAQPPQEHTRCSQTQGSFLHLLYKAQSPAWTKRQLNSVLLDPLMAEGQTKNGGCEINGKP